MLPKVGQIHSRNGWYLNSSDLNGSAQVQTPGEYVVKRYEYKLTGSAAQTSQNIEVKSYLIFDVMSQSQHRQPEFD